MAETTPAGWFPDPEDATQLRYWDGAEWTEQRSAAPAPAITPPEAKPFYKRAWFIAMAAILGLSLLVAIVNPSPQEPNVAATGTRTTKKPVASKPITSTPVTTVATSEPEPAVTVEEEAPEPEKPKKPEYKTLSKRKFAKLIKNPDNYVDETFTIYGVVTQFDAATGTESFRADVGYKKLKPSYGMVDYEANAILAGFEDDLDDIVEDDLFKAKVIVTGSVTYETQMGGEATVPQFGVVSIKRYGSVD